jgi:transcriptional regulator GlxA family with amidase domain
MRAVGQVHDLAGPVLSLSADGPALAVAREIAERTGGNGLASSFRASALAYSLVMALLEEVGGAGTEAPARRMTQAAADYCREHLADGVSVRSLARLCGLSQWHFSRLFKAEHGLSPGAFLQVERVREAARLLQDTDLPLKVVAEQCGFSDANYLGKVFRQHTGVSPGAYRRSGV